MITGELKNKVDRVWDAFWSGGISNPLEVIEQITYLLFLAGALRARTQWVLARIATAAHGTKRLETAVLESIPIPEVAREAQDEFTQRIAQSNARRTAVERALAANDELFASLQSRAFAGEL